MVHQNKIKLCDFGLSRRIEERSKSSSELFGVIPYIDPNKLNNQKNYEFNKKSDVYSLGVIFWEISSGRPPFKDTDYDVCLIMRIILGHRETTVEDTSIEYIRLYTGNYKHVILIIF